MTDVARTDEIVSDFNSLLFDMLREFYKVSPNSIVSTNRDQIEKGLSGFTNSSDSNKRTKVIEVFVVKVLVHKEEIDQGNDDFFLTKSYDSEADGDTFILGIINELKKIWPQLKQQNRENLMQYMQYLCELAQSYFIEIDSN